jgi:hypothetical protein
MSSNRLGIWALAFSVSFFSVVFCFGQFHQAIAAGKTNPVTAQIKPEETYLLFQAEADKLNSRYDPCYQNQRTYSMFWRPACR